MSPPQFEHENQPENTHRAFGFAVVTIAFAMVMGLGSQILSGWVLVVFAVSAVIALSAVVYWNVRRADRSPEGPSA